MNTRALLKSGILSALILIPVASLQAEIKETEFEAMMDKYLTTEKGQEKIGSSMETYFRKRQEMAAKKQEELMKGQIEEQFKNPVKIDAGKSPAKGPAEAKVTIIEFSDFQCPYCSKGRDTMEALLKEYPKDVKVVFKNLPLPFHPEAMPAAKAALAAHRQGKFWEMHDSLFANQQKLAAEFYDSEASRLGLDVEKFKKDMESKEIEEEVKADAALAAQHGIQGTPGFFVNGVAVKGAYPVEHFKEIVDRWLKG